MVGVRPTIEGTAAGRIRQRRARQWPGRDRESCPARPAQLPVAVSAAITDAISSATTEIGKFARAKERDYGRPLRVAYPLAGEVEPNACGIPGAGGDPGSMEREHYHPFIGGHFAMSPRRSKNYSSAVAWTGLCRSNLRQSSGGQSGVAMPRGSSGGWSMT